MTYTPAISVIIPAYNAETVIGRAIESALNQTYRPLEILVIDDGSIDQTASMAAEYDSPVRVIRQGNGGPAAARNRGASECQGDWIALLDADDVWLPDKLLRQTAYMDDQEVAIVCCLCCDREVDPTELVPITFERLWRRNLIANSSAVVRRAVFEEAGGFDEDRSLISVEDYNLWLRIVWNGGKVALCPEKLWRYLPIPGNLSSQTERFAQAELANAAKLAKAFCLTTTVYNKKRADINRVYGHELLYKRKILEARPYLRDAALQHPSANDIAWWFASYIPPLFWRFKRSAE